jgi:penicillin amidase
VTELHAGWTLRGAGTKAVVVVVGLLLALALWRGGQWLALNRAAREAFPQVSGQLRVVGLESRLEIHRDSRGVCHLEGGSESDAWFGLGFVQAQDRAAQMLWLRRLARGRTAEILGERGLAGDRLVRTLGVARLAEARLERIDRDVREMLEAYARGVNAHLERLRSGSVAPPIDLLEPRASIEVWTPGDSLALIKLVHWHTANSHDTVLVLEDLIERLRAVAARPFFPTDAGGLSPALAAELPTSEPGDGAAGVAKTTSLAGASSRQPPPVSPFSLGGGAWVLAGRHTTSGAPILTAIFDTAPTAPSLIYEAHLRGGELDVAGATIPGIPVFWAGRNPHVAWAAIPARAVTVDLFREVVRAGEPALYRSGSRWLPLEEHSETLAVRTAGGGMREESLRVRSTRHGPLINPLLEGEREPLALAWTGAQPGDGVTGMLGVARARSAAELRSALREHHEPVVELLYADRNGDGGMQVAGWIPQRVLQTGLDTVPGPPRKFDWRKPVEFDALPAASLSVGAGRDQSAGGSDWIVAGGRVPDDALSGVQIEWLRLDRERARRFERLLGELTRAGTVDLHAAAATQLDVGREMASQVVVAIASLAGEGDPLTREAEEVAALIGGWDGAVRADSAGAAAYQVLLQHLLRELFIEPVGEELLRRYVELPGVSPESLVERIVVAASEFRRRGGWTDRDRVGAAVRVCLHRSWLTLANRLGPNRSRWQWGRLHQLSFHPVVTARSAGDFSRSALGPFDRGGDGLSVDRSDFAPSYAFGVTRGSFYRLAIDLASPDRMLSTLAPGQSEHPGHPHFDSGVARWLEGKAGLFATSRFLLEEERLERLVLEPGS